MTRMPTSAVCSMSSYDPEAIPTTHDLSAPKRRVHPVAEGRKLNFDGFVESPSAAVRFIFRHGSVRLGTPHSSTLFRLRRIGAPCIASLCRLPWRLLTKSSNPPSTRPGGIRIHFTLYYTTPATALPTTASSPHCAPATYCDRGSGGPSLRAAGSVGRNAVGAASSRDGVGYGREVYSAKASRQGVIAALIVSSEAWRCSEGAHKIREASLSAKEGSGSGCPLPHSSPCLWRRPVLPSRKPGVIGCSFGRLRTSSRCDALKKYASGPSPCGCPVARPSPRSRYGVSCRTRAREA